MNNISVIIVKLFDFFFLFDYRGNEWNEIAIRECVGIYAVRGVLVRLFDEFIILFVRNMYNICAPIIGRINGYIQTSNKNVYFE